MTADYERFRQVVAKCLGVRITDVVPNASLIDIGGASLDFAELIMDCEEQFRVAIPDEEAYWITTVGQLFAYINDKLQPGEDVWPPPPRWAPQT